MKSEPIASAVVGWPDAGFFNLALFATQKKTKGALKPRASALVTLHGSDSPVQSDSAREREARLSPSLARNIAIAPTWSEPKFFAPAPHRTHVTVTRNCRSYATLSVQRSIMNTILQVEPIVGFTKQITLPSVPFADEVVFRSRGPDIAIEVQFEVRGNKQVLVVAREGQRLADVTLNEIHGAVAKDPLFGVLGGSEVCWNEDGTQFLYVARALSSEGCLAEDVNPMSGLESWQIWLGDISQLSKPQVHLVLASRPELVFGQPVFVGKTTIVVTGYTYVDLPDPESHYRRHHSRLYSVELDSQLHGINLTAITPAHRSAHSARAELARFVFLSSRVGGHNCVVQLQSRRLPLDVNQANEVLVDEVRNVFSKDAFPGLYLEQLPANPFISGGQIVFSSVWGSRRLPLLISSDGAVECLSPVCKSGYFTPDRLCSYTVETTDGDHMVLAIRGVGGAGPELVFMDLTSAAPKWQVLVGGVMDLVQECQKATASLFTATLVVPVACTEVIILSGSPVVERQLADIAVFSPAKNVAVSASRAGAGGGPKLASPIPPTIVIPHKGHEMSVVTGDNSHATRLAMAGYTVALVNYTGSAGFGADAMNALKGNVGSLDVLSVKAAIDFLVELGITSSSPGKLMMEGNSHGGYLAASIASQYPQLLSSIVLRNPVLDLTACVVGSQRLPHWPLIQMTEGGSLQNLRRIAPTLDQISGLMKASPIHKASSVLAPSLVLVSDDAEFSQGRAWCHTINQHKNTKSVCKSLRPKSGSFESVEAELESSLATMDWFSKYANFK